MNIKIYKLEPEKCAQWDGYIEANNDATFFHLSGWQTVLEKAFGHTAHYLYAVNGDDIVGVLPLLHVKSLLFGNTLSSLPFAVYGGVLSDNDDVRNQLIESACALAQSLGVDALEFRNQQRSAHSWPVKNLYVTFKKTMSEDNDVNMQAIPRKQRAVVRKGIKAGLVAEDNAEWRRLYRLYAESVRNLGTPVFGSKYFELLRKVFKDQSRVLVVSDNGVDVCGVLSFYFKDEVLPYYAGARPRARALKANDYMYWELMKRSVEQGVKRFDFGRSKIGSGSYSYKKNWGFEPLPLHYEYFLVKSLAMPEVNPNNPKYSLFIDLWKKLPLPVANVLGPFLARNLG